MDCKEGPPAELIDFLSRLVLKEEEKRKEKFKLPELICEILKFLHEIEIEDEIIN